jgi:formylglycine-generating enzyme required for sulfatase activity
LEAVGWYAGNSDDKLRPVGELAPNQFGLYDMHGNIWEWIEDTWQGHYKGAPDDGSAWVDSNESLDRVVRGGSWFNPAWNCRVAYRGRRVSGLRHDAQGFRLVLFPGQPR